MHHAIRLEVVKCRTEVAQFLLRNVLRCRQVAIHANGISRSGSIAAWRAAERDGHDGTVAVGRACHVHARVRVPIPTQQREGGGIIMWTLLALVARAIGTMRVGYHIYPGSQERLQCKIDQRCAVFTKVPRNSEIQLAGVCCQT